MHLTPLMGNFHIMDYEIKTAQGYTYAEAGAGNDGTPVLLLHGMMGDISNWEATIPAVARAGYRIVCPILPVYSMPLRQASLEGLVEFVKDFTSKFGLERAVVTGNSMGGHLAVLYALAYPERVAGLVLTGASGIFEVEMSSSIMRRKDREYLRPRVAKTFFDPSHVTEELLDDVIDIINDRDKAVRLIRFARSVEKRSIRDDLGDIQAPTLLVWGKQDEITPPDVARMFHEGISDSELHFVDKCGHVPMQEQPDIFNAHMIDFLSRIAHAPSTAKAS